MQEGPPAQSWSLAERAVFRVVFAYVVLSVEPFPLDLLPVAGKWIDDVNGAAWQAVVAFVARHLLHIDAPYVENGSGDRTWDWVSQLVALLASVVATLVWSALDRRRASYAKLLEWLRVGLRYWLAMAMLSYGAIKIYKSQFPFPGPERLVERVGDMSPMGLLWTFMGYSTAYTIFTGVAEFTGGVLLFFRRTTTLGALVVVCTLSNVVMLNFCYDVPGKIYSSQLLATALFLLAPDARRLFDVLVLHRATAARTFPPHFASVRARRAELAVKVLAIGYLLFARVSDAREAYAQWGDGAPRAPLHGIWKVEAFTREGRDVDATDAERWVRLVLNDQGRLSITHVNDKRERLWFVDDAEHHVLEMHIKSDEKIALSYARPDQTHLTLDGDFRGAKVAVKLTRVDDGEFQLMTRGFHWVNEMPFNQ